DASQHCAPGAVRQLGPPLRGRMSEREWLHGINSLMMSCAGAARRGPATMLQLTGKADPADHAGSLGDLDRCSGSLPPGGDLCTAPGWAGSDKQVMCVV